MEYFYLNENFDFVINVGKKFLKSEEECFFVDFDTI